LSRSDHRNSLPSAHQANRKISFDRVIWICASHAIPGGTSDTAFFEALLLLCCGIAAGSSLRFIKKGEAKEAALRNPPTERHAQIPFDKSGTGQRCNCRYS
jgi:hypothetical protein